MTLPYCWTHWFWITFYLSSLVGVDLAPLEAAPSDTALLPLWLVETPSAIVTETFPSAETDPHFPFARQPQWTQYRETVNPGLNLYSSSLFEAATRSLDGSETQNPVSIVETEAPMLGDEPPRVVKSPSIPPPDTSIRKLNNNTSETSSKLGEPIKKTTRMWAKDPTASGPSLVQANVSSTASNKSQSDKAPPLSTPSEEGVNLTISARLPKTLPKQREITFGEDYNSTEMPPPRTNLTLLEEIEAELQANQRRPQETAAAVAAAEGLPDERQLDAAAIAGIAVGLAATAALIVAATIVLYRRRYLNQPHTLNDKCSNPDSSGYIDDTTLRENSEEMYSLDNDSFLNSLEAMTIQNYWTDSVKHTKL